VKIVWRYLLFLCLALAFGPVALAQDTAPTPNPIPTPRPDSQAPVLIPNDPRFPVMKDWADQLGLTQAYAVQQTKAIVSSKVIVAIFGEGIEPHPDLLANYRQDLNFNVTDKPFLNGNHHERAVASIIAAGTSNGVAVSSVAGLTDKVEFFSVKVCDNGLCKISDIQKGLQYVSQKVRDGHNIVAINFSYSAGDSDPSVTQPLIRQLGDLGVVFFGAGPTPSVIDAPPINVDQVNNLFVSYARQFWNVIGVTALRQDGEQLIPTGPYGQTMGFAAPGENVQVVGTLDPMNSSASFSNTSASTPHVTAIYALIRAWAETDPHKALDRLKMTAKMIPALEGKVAYGIPDAYLALTAPLGCPAPSDEIMWVTRPGSKELVALDAVTQTKGPFTVAVSPEMFASDGKRRLMLFAYNVPLSPAAVTIWVQGTNIQLPVENVSNLVTPLGCVQQINVKLVTDLPSGYISLFIVSGDKASTANTITITP
jgi:hypothetical protein